MRERITTPSWDDWPASVGLRLGTSFRLCPSSRNAEFGDSVATPLLQIRFQRGAQVRFEVDRAKPHAVQHYCVKVGCISTVFYCGVVEPKGNRDGAKNVSLPVKEALPLHVRRLTLLVQPVFPR